MFYASVFNLNFLTSYVFSIASTHSKLTASRYLRIRKIIYHVRRLKISFFSPPNLSKTLYFTQVQDKLDKLHAGSKTISVRSSVDDQGQGQVQVQTGASRTPAEDLYEIICNDTLLPHDMTLAAVRQYVWKQGTELALHYRRKRTPELK